MSLPKRGNPTIGPDVQKFTYKAKPYGPIFWVRYQTNPAVDKNTLEIQKDNIRSVVAQGMCNLHKQRLLSKVFVWKLAVTNFFLEILVVLNNDMTARNFNCQVSG